MCMKERERTEHKCEVLCKEAESGGSTDREVAANDQQEGRVTHVNELSWHMLGCTWDCLRIDEWKIPPARAC